MTRAEAPFALRRLYRSLSPRTLERLRVPLGDLIDVLVEDDDGELVAGDAGVNLALTDDPRGLAVGIPLWAGAQAFEEIDVQWGGSLALSHFLLPGELDAPDGVLYLRVPLRRLQDGQAQVQYKVLHLDGNASESAPIRVLVKRTRPGGRDDDAEAPGHQGLVPAGLADELIENGIGPIEAAVGVEVTLAAYEHMRVRDLVELDWGGERLVHVVAADEVGHDLILVVTEALILAAGDGEIKLAWKVTDEVLNSSRDADERPWSASTTVDVYASDAQLYPPYVKIRDEYVDEVIDLNALDLDDVTVEVFTDPHHFAVGHWVELFWNGFTAEGEAIRYRQQTQVERVPGAVTFFVPNTQAQPLGGGRVVLYYQLKAGETTPPLHSSHRTSRRIEGEGAGIGLRAPQVLEAVGGHLDPSLAEATIQVVAYPGIKLGDVLTVVFSGTRADGSEVYFDHTRNVTSGQIEDGKIERFVPGEYIAALDGRRAEVYYLVNGRRSQTLGLIVGELQATLAAPSVHEVEEGVLDPANVGAQGATLEIPLYTGIALGDVVTYLWLGSEADGSTSDQSQISSLTQPLLFDVPKTYVEANLNGSVEVRYSVERDGHPGQMSQVYSFRVGVLELELVAPTVLEAPGGVLDPLDGQGGVRVEVSYAGMATTDRITLHWRGTPIAGSAELGPFAGDASGTLLIDIEAALVGANIGPAVMPVRISYSVLRAGEDAQEPLQSAELLLSVQPLPELELVELEQAQGGELDLSGFSGDPVITIARWPFIAPGQRVWLKVIGIKNDGQPHIITLLENSAVTGAEANNGLSKAIPRRELQLLKRDSPFTVEFKIGFDRSANEDVSVLAQVVGGIIKFGDLLAYVREFGFSQRTYNITCSADGERFVVVLEDGDCVHVNSLTGERKTLMRASTYVRPTLSQTGEYVYVPYWDGVEQITVDTLARRKYLAGQSLSHAIVSADEQFMYCATGPEQGQQIQLLKVRLSDGVVLHSQVFGVKGGVDACLALNSDNTYLVSAGGGKCGVYDAHDLSSVFDVPVTNYVEMPWIVGDRVFAYQRSGEAGYYVFDLVTRVVKFTVCPTLGPAALSASGRHAYFTQPASSSQPIIEVYEVDTRERIQAMTQLASAWDITRSANNVVYVSNRAGMKVFKFA